jgi:hypothetical protein
LHERFGDPPLFVYKWTGKNSHGQRRKAALKLREELTNWVQEHKTARHFLICHSHGGSVALTALEDPDLREKIAGVVCMATPFFVARQRDLGPNPRAHAAGAVVLIMFLTIGLVSLFVVPTSWSGLARLAVTISATAIVMGVLVPLLVTWQRYAQKLLSKLPPVAVEPDRVLIIRSPNDEASGSLSFVQLVAHVCVRLYVRAVRLYDRFEKAANGWAKRKAMTIIVAGVSFVATLGLLVAAGAVLEWQDGSRSFVHVCAIVIAFMPLLICVPALFLSLGRVGEATFYFRMAAESVVWPIIFVLSIFLLPLGWETAVANILLDITAETTPAGSWRIHLIEPPNREESGSDSFPLMHSVVYENPRVFQLIGDWIAQTSASTPPG